MTSFPSLAVIPYLPYSKQCRMRRRACITSKLIAKMMCNAGTMSHILVYLSFRDVMLYAFRFINQA